MKTKHFFLALAAGLALLVSCKPEKPVFGIQADKETLQFNKEGGTLDIVVTTGQSWTITKPATATWINVSPTSGTGSATVHLTTLPNAGKKKSAAVKIDAGMAGYVNVNVSQLGELASGDGLTYATAWSPSEAKEWILANLPNETSGSSLVGSGGQKYWIHGFIHKINVYNEKTENFANSGDFGNASFYISDSMEETNDDVTCYQVYYLGNKKFTGPFTEENPDIKVGDEVYVYGPVANFNSKPNTLGKGAAFIYELNGKSRGGAVTEETTPSGNGTLENPYNAAGAVAFIKSASFDPEKKVYVRGVISDKDEVEGPFKATTGTAIFSISEDGADYKTQFKCYGVYYLGNSPWIEGYSNVKPGDQVVVYGKLTFYQASVIYETADKEAYIYSLNGKTEPEPAFFVPKTAYTVRAADTEAEIDVFGSVAWTASVTGGATIAEPAGGNGAGNGKVKITFPANTSKDNNNVFTVTIATQDAAVTTAKSYTVTVTQNKDVDGVEVIFTQAIVVAKDPTFPTSGKACDITIDGVKLAFTNGCMNGNLKDLRIYKSGSMTISATTGTIQEIHLTSSSTGDAQSPERMLNKFGAGAPAGLVVSDDNASATWTGNQQSVTFTATDAQVRMTEIRVIYLP
jgi:hypothetical protein